MAPRHGHVEGDHYRIKPVDQRKGRGSRPGLQKAHRVRVQQRDHNQQKRRRAPLAERTHLLDERETH